MSGGDVVTKSLAAAVSIITDSSLYWLTATLAAITSVAHLSAQQMYDAYLPLLAKTHWKTHAVAAGTSHLLDAKSPSTSRCFSLPSAFGFGFGAAGRERSSASVDSGRDLGGVASAAPAAGSVPGGVASSEGLVVDAAAGAGAAEVDGVSLLERVARMRQSVASELAFVAPSLGFLSLFVVTFVQLVWVLTVSDTLLSPRLCVLTAGLWGFLFGIAGLSGLRKRPGFPFQKGDGSVRAAVSTLSNLGFRRSWLTVRLLCRHHPEMGRLMLGQLLSAITNGTVLASYTVFIQRELNATGQDLILILLIGAVVSVLSINAFTRVVGRFSHKSLKWLFVLVKAVSPVWPVWVSLGFRQRWEMFVLVAGASVLNPIILPLLRSIFQQALPQGYEASLFSLLGVCNVSFTWIGSLVIAASLSITGSMRMGFLFVDLFVLVGIVLFVRFDVDKAQEDRKKIEESEEFANGEFTELRTGLAAVEIGEGA